MPKPGTVPDLILGQKGERHVSKSVSACSLGQMKDIRGQVGQLSAKKVPKRRIGLCCVLRKRTVKNTTSSCRAQALSLTEN